jgi:hypothetical protein
MTAMANQPPAADDLLPLPEPQLFAGNAIPTRIRLLSSLRMFATLLMAPLLLLAAIVGFLAVLADFSLFRLRHHRAGHPAPKGLWEF